MTEDDRKKFGPFRLDYTVTVPDLIGIVGALIAVGLAWGALSSRLDIHEIQIKQHDKEIVELRKVDADARTELRSDLREINIKLDRLVEREVTRR